MGSSHTPGASRVTSGSGWARTSTGCINRPYDAPTTARAPAYTVRRRRALSSSRTHCPTIQHANAMPSKKAAAHIMTLRCHQPAHRHRDPKQPERQVPINAGIPCPGVKRSIQETRLRQKAHPTRTQRQDRRRGNAMPSLPILRNIAIMGADAAKTKSKCRAQERRGAEVAKNSRQHAVKEGRRKALSSPKTDVTAWYRQYDIRQKVQSPVQISERPSAPQSPDTETGTPNQFVHQRP